MNQAPPSWIQSIKQTAIDTMAIPLSGYTPSFPWEEFSNVLAPALGLPQCHIHVTAARTLAPDEILQPFGSQPVTLPIETIPIPGHCFFLMAKEEIEPLASLVLTESGSYRGFLSSLLQEGFYHHLCTQAAALINHQQYFNTLTLKIAKTLPLPNESALCIDIEIVTSKRPFWARLVLPASFHAALKTHFAQKTAESIHLPLFQKTTLPVLITLGQTQLSFQELKGLKQGDFLLLSQCLWDPEHKKGTALLTLQNTPIFRLRLKEDHLKILNYAIAEDLPTMDPNTPSSADFNPEEEKEFAEIEEGAHFGTTNEESTQEEPGLISTAQIPITLVVEVSRIRMSLDELLRLSPGNTLDLSMRPEQGVCLTIDGKRIAKGELIKMGDLLGVRILQLGASFE